MYLTDTRKKAIDDDYKVGALFVDFKKTFGTVYRAILKFELPDVGVSGVFHEWLTSYFHNERSQYVNVTDARSKLRQLGIGVPKVLSWDPDCFHYMLTTYRIPPKLDESICLQVTLPSTTLGTNSKKLLMRYT